MKLIIIAYLSLLVFIISDKSQSAHAAACNDQVSAGSYELSGFRFFVSSKSFGPLDDIDGDIKKEYGPSAELADWLFLKENLSSASAARKFANSLNIVKQGPNFACNNYLVRRGSDWSYEGKRLFFARHDGTKPNDWLTLDEIGSNILDLGRWNHNARALVSVPVGGVGELAEIETAPSSGSAQQNKLQQGRQSSRSDGAHPKENKNVDYIASIIWEAGQERLSRALPKDAPQFVSSERADFIKKWSFGIQKFENDECVIVLAGVDKTPPEKRWDGTPSEVRRKTILSIVNLRSIEDIDISIGRRSVRDYPALFDPDGLYKYIRIGSVTFTGGGAAHRQRNVVRVNSYTMASDGSVTEISINDNVIADTFGLSENALTLAFTQEREERVVSAIKAIMTECQ
ncbi:hypothetical protein V5F29_19210 [Xanthobacter aminoxidans]|uniref:hypothetical protein n=1 Tax=Xanthobacter aminoxidans TaxID=186280 RepID=UPI00372847E5